MLRVIVLHKFNIDFKH